MPAAGEFKIPSPIGGVILFLTLASGLFGTVFWVARDRGPKSEDVEKVSLALRSEHRAGDLIIIAPDYVGKPLEVLGDLHPVSPRDPSAEDFRAHERVWVLGFFTKGEKLRPKMTAAGLISVKESEPSPGITVDLYEVPNPQKIEYSFLERVASARVFHEHDGRPEPCDRFLRKNGQGGEGEGWSCPHDSEWFYVAQEWHRMGDQLRRCLWAHPPNSGRLVIAYPGVPLTGELHIRGGHTLNSSVYAREKIDLEVSVSSASGTSGQKFEFALKEHWRPFSVQTATVGTATVSFAISSPDAGANHFCFTADMRASP